MLQRRLRIFTSFSVERGPSMATHSRISRFCAGFGILTLLTILLSGAVTAQDAAPTLPWWNDRVFYEIFVRSFADSDGDGIGDLRGIIDRLDYLNDGNPETTSDLGVTGIWLMPINPSPSYHGYDVTDYYGINPEYGMLEDFQELLAEAHARGIAVIIDLVLNHTSREHPWFEAAAAGDPGFEDWYIWASEPLFRGPQGQQVWHPLGNRYYYGYFDSGMPDLNYNNPAVTEQMTDVARFWVEDVGVDGFRIDAAKHLFEEGDIVENVAATHAWFADFESVLESIDPNILTVGEVAGSSLISRAYVRDRELDLVFNFDLAFSALDSASRGSNSAVEAIQVRDAEQFPPGQYASFLTNHDQTRVMTTLGGLTNNARSAASILLTSPGVPFLYYGEEIGMTGARPPDQNVRTPMQWNAEPNAGFTTSDRPWRPPNGDAQEGVNVAEQEADEASLFSHYRRLIQLRNSYAPLRQGDFAALDCDERALYAFVRAMADEAAIVLINLGDEPLSELSCSTRASGLAGTYTGALIFGSASEIAVPRDFEEDGGFSDFTPVNSIDGYETTIILLSR